MDPCGDLELITESTYRTSSECCNLLKSGGNNCLTSCSHSISQSAAHAFIILKICFTVISVVSTQFITLSLDLVNN